MSKITDFSASAWLRSSGKPRRLGPSAVSSSSNGKGVAETPAGQPASLLGYPVTEAEDMPDMAANAFAIAFGDFRRGYLIADRQGIRVLRDPFSAKPYVLFYTTKRVGGGVQNFEAIKLMKFDVS